MRSGEEVLVGGYLFQMKLMPDWMRGMAEVIYTTLLLIMVVYPNWFVYFLKTAGYILVGNLVVEMYLI
jgi:hypothetical protein